MIHFGDITQIKGADVPLVDIVCGGSPCQDLSVAGKREGLAGARSGLFMEQIRVIKEMRDVSRKRVDAGTDEYIRPRYMVWENVPGAFSSNKGEDFRAVLECERLQGYPDGWTDIGEWVDSKGKKHKDADSPRYKALGNSIALPFWEWMAKRMVSHIDHKPTMASLFDGIGGFPLVYSRAGCEPIWASEIEEFPIAVTKRRFGGNDA